MARTADQVQVGDVLVFRPNPDALTADVLPTVYRRVEEIEEHQLRRDPGMMYCWLFRPPRSMGHWHYADADEKVEVTDEITESCSVSPT